MYLEAVVWRLSSCLGLFQLLAISCFNAAGEQKFWFTGANAENFEACMQRNMLPEENPASGLGSFALRAHRARVGLVRS